MPAQSSTAELSPAPSPSHTQILLQAASEEQISSRNSLPNDHEHEALTYEAALNQSPASLKVPTSFNHPTKPENSPSFDPDEKPSGHPTKKRRLSTVQHEQRVKAKVRKEQVREEKENEKLERVRVTHPCVLVPSN